MVVAGSMPVPTVLCVVLGTLLFLALGALAVQMYCAWARRRGGSWGWVLGQGRFGGENE